MSAAQAADKHTEGNQGTDLDVSTASRGIWLVKVPKYISERWQKNDKSSDVGKLRIAPSKIPGGKQEVIFSLKPELAELPSSQGASCPIDHKFVMTLMGTHHFSILSQATPTAEAKIGDNSEHVGIEGKITHRAECQPIADAKYMKLKREHMMMQNKPTRQIKQIDTVINSYKPVSDHKFNIEAKRQKQDHGKRTRDDADIVKERLFGAFEKHQYYYLKDLERITNQPTSYLKEILKEMCTYNLKAPYRNMWELKPEYRYYKDKNTSDT